MKYGVIEFLAEISFLGVDVLLHWEHIEFRPFTISVPSKNE